MSSRGLTDTRGWRLLVRALEPALLWRLSLLSLACQALISLFRWREGFVYGAHRYFAQQYLDGMDPYSVVGCVPEAPSIMLHFLPPRFLSHVAIFWAEDLTGLPVYLLVQWALLGAAVLLVRHLTERGVVAPGVAQILYLLLAFNPGLISSNVIVLGDGIFIIPLTLAVLAALHRSPTLGAVVAGLSIGWSVPMVLLGPLVFIHTAHGAREGRVKRLARGGLAWGLGLGAAVLPLSLAGQEGARRWLAGEWQSPSWFSIWAALGDLPVAPFHLGAIAGWTAVVACLYGVQRLSLRGAVMATVGAFGVFSMYAPAPVLLVCGVVVVAGISEGRRARLIGALMWLESQLLVSWYIINGHLLEDRFLVFMRNHRHGLPIDAIEALVLWAPALLALWWIVQPKGTEDRPMAGGLEPTPA